jgi:hypothetical protein
MALYDIKAGKVELSVDELSDLFGFQEVPVPDEPAEPTPYELEFEYDGSIRVVQNPTVVPGAYQHGRYNSLLAGIEVTKDDFPTGQYKQYHIEKVRFA